MAKVSGEENKLKRAILQIGVIITAEDAVHPDVLMTYVMNSLNMVEQSGGQIREVQVREISIPSLEFIREDEKEINLNQLGTNSARH